MPETDFTIEDKSSMNGICFILKYSGQTVLCFEHIKTEIGMTNFLLSYNIYTPSNKPLIELIDPSMDFLEKLKSKQARTFRQALEDAKMYDRTIFKNMDLSVPEATGCENYTLTKLPFDKDGIKMKNPENRFDYVNMANPHAKVNVERVNYNENPYGPQVNQNHITELTINAWDPNISDELAELVSTVASTQVPETDLSHLQTNLTQILNQFKPEDIVSSF